MARTYVQALPPRFSSLITPLPLALHSNGVDRRERMYRILNLVDYSPFEMFLNITATVLWAAAYIVILRNGLRRTFIEMPALAGVGNISWEVLWSTVFQPNMGPLIVWGVRAWLLLDLVIVYVIVKRGRLQWLNPMSRRHFVPFAFGMMLVWLGFFYTFTSAGFDTPVGGRSALILNLTMSCLYLAMGTRLDLVRFMSPAAAILKGLGTAFFTAFVFVGTPNDHISIWLGSAVFVVDCTYTWHLIRLRRGDPDALAEAAPIDVDAALEPLPS